VQLQQAAVACAYSGGAAAVLPEQVAQYDAATEEKLSRWVAAKRGKDYTTADQLREELKAIGIDAEKARPSLAAGGPPAPIVRAPLQPPPPPAYMAHTAVPPPPSLPPNLFAHSQPPPKRQRTIGSQQFDPETEMQLESWMAAKRAKDFVTADRIRDDLRAKGVQPDSARPPLR